MSDNDAQVNLLEHSEAKVMPYGKYLAIYLNILARVDFIDKICIFDLLCGEGVYENGEKGSPLIAIEKIKDHYYANNQTCPNMVLWFNDSEKSKIEISIKKIDRVERLVSQNYVPASVDVKYSSEDYFDIHRKAVQFCRKSIKTKSLFFIDPYGYKGITPSHIKETLVGGNNEVLLFLPITFMYRFANKAMSSAFSGGEELRNFLDELFGKNKVPRFSSSHDFIENIKSQFREIFNNAGVFVDTFTIERDSSNLYCLFFFTSHKIGFERMLETKWKMDDERGAGFRFNNTLPLFSASNTSGYPDKLREYIETHQGCTNHEVRLFGLHEGFLAKQTNEVLSSWLTPIPQLKLTSLDNKSVRKSSTYVSNKERTVAYFFRG